MKQRFDIIFLLVLLLSSCAAAPKSGTEKKTGSAKPVMNAEDVSVYRPKFPEPEIQPVAHEKAPEPTNHVNEKVRVVLDSLANANRNIRYAEGYRVLVYNGTDRGKAMDLRKIVIERFPDQKEYLTYKQPSYKLKVGDFLSRLEAQEVLLKIQDIAPQALILPEQVNIIR